MVSDAQQIGIPWYPRCALNQRTQYKSQINHLNCFYANDIGASLWQGKIMQYADDTTLYFRYKTSELVEQQALEELNKKNSIFQKLQPNSIYF